MKTAFFVIVMCLSAAVFGCLQFWLGYTHGLNSAPAPVTNFIEIEKPVEVERVWESVRHYCATVHGTFEPLTEANEHTALYKVTVSLMYDGGYSEPKIILPYGAVGFMVVTLSINSCDFAIKVVAVEGRVPKLDIKPEPEPEGGEDDF